MSDEHDDGRALAHWRNICPELFEKCKASEISEYQLLHKLQHSTPDAAFTELLAEHQVRQQQRQRQQQQQQQQQQLLEQQRGEAGALGETGADSSSGSEGEDGAGSSGASAGSDESLPAWVGLHEEMRERRELLLHALVQACSQLEPAAVD